MTEINQNDISLAVEYIKSAEIILIGAGAGISAAAGPQFDYANVNWFKTHYPAMIKYGYNRKIELMGGFWLPPELQWGFYAQNVKEVRYGPPGQDVYTKLWDIVKKKDDFFVITTNVDKLFVRNGFPEEKVYTPQGDYARMQCMKPCTQETWDTKPFLERILASIDPATQMASPDTIPKCPNCGGKAFLNVRGDDSFIHQPYEKQAAAYQQWIKHALNKNLVILDIGSGFNTPVWVRWPVEQITYQNRLSHLIRINPNNPEVPKEITNRSLSFASDASDIIKSIWNELELELELDKNFEKND